MKQQRLKKILNTAFPLVLGAAILWWMYRDFDFRRMASYLRGGMNWWWMAFSLVFGVTAQVFRGLRWTQALEPLGETARKRTCVYAVFVSYAASLLIPRIGEITRCGVLSRYDGVSFAKSVGTVVTERIIDTLLILLVVAAVFFLQIGVFMDFFDRTGTNLSGWFGGFTTTGYVVTLICLVVTLLFLIFAMKKLTIFAKVRKVVGDLKAGALSLRDVRKKWMFLAYTLGIWVSYFLHFYITFFCFDFTEGLGVMTALVAFVVGSIAVIVPTPNGMGPWHFAVKTVLVLYGVAAVDGEAFVLIVHTIQTALIPLLGVVGMLGLAGMAKKGENAENVQKK